MLRDRDVICISSVAWDSYRLSLHQYMSRLARTNRVLFVQRPRSLTGVLRAPRRATDAATWRGDVRHVVDGLYVATPPPALPLRFERPVASVNQRVRRAWVRAAAARLGFRDALLWIHEPDAAGVVGRVDESFSLYWVTDDHPTGPTFRANRTNRVSAMRAREHELLRAVDLVMCTAPTLRDLKRPYNENTHLVPHGVDSEHFAQALRDDLPVSDMVARLPPPVIGMVGQLNARVDTPLLAEVARARPRWSLALVGPVVETFDAAPIAALPNVHLLGAAPLAEVPGVLKGMAACMVPFRVDEHTRAMSPLKTLEYLAAGRPVVATPLPAMAAYGEQIAIATGAGPFLSALDRALEDHDPEQVAARVRFARAHSWEGRLEQISGLIDATTPRRGRRSP